MKKFLVLLFVLFLNPVSASIIGNDIINRSHVDGAVNINFIDKSLAFDTDGVITSWDIFAGRSNSEFALQVFRNISGNTYELIGSNYFANAGGVGVRHLTVAESEQINFLAGDVIGWWFGNGKGVIDYTYGGGSGSWDYNDTTTIGDTVTINNSTRVYSIAANYSAVPEPSIIALLGLGLVGLGFSSRRKLKA